MGVHADSRRVAIARATALSPAALAVLALAAPALLPSSAGAVRATRAGCSITLAAPASVPAGEDVGLTGALACEAAGDAAGQPVTIEEHVAGTPGRAPAGTVSTDAAGQFSFTTPSPLERRAVFFARALGARSPRAPVAVLAGVSVAASVPPGSLLALARRRGGVRRTAGASVSFSGAVSPAIAGARVVLQRESASAPGDWRRIGVGTTGAEGRYALAHAFGLPGPVTVRVVVRAHGVRPTVSEELSFEVAHRQNPRLTFFASAPSVAYGTRVSVHGALRDGAGRSVTLLARGRGGVFTALASTICGAGGAYEFPALAPTRSATYRVVAGGVRSTSTRVGVSPALSASPPPAPLQAGQPLALTGTLTPATAGQVVYLERLERGGVAFHVVAVATVGTDARFSFSDVVPAYGATYRVKVPRSPELQAVAGEPFSVTVAGG